LTDVHATGRKITLGFFLGGGEESGKAHPAWEAELNVTRHVITYQNYLTAVTLIDKCCRHTRKWR